MNTYSKHTNDVGGVYAATLVTGAQWDQAKQNGGANAVIYGIPMAATYGSFYDTATNEMSSYTFSAGGADEKSELRSVLSRTAAGAYETCLAEQFDHIAVWVANTSSGFLVVKFSLFYGRNRPNPSHVQNQSRRS